jgi:uncharacterized protein with beta-barrel porin domain
MRIVSLIDERDVIEKMLKCLGLWEQGDSSFGLTSAPQFSKNTSMVTSPSTPKPPLALKTRKAISYPYLVPLLIYMSSTALWAVEVYDLSPAIPRVTNPGEVLSDITDTGNLQAEIAISGDTTPYGGLKIHADVQNDFRLSQELVVTYGGAANLPILDQLFIEGTTPSDTLTLSSVALSPSSPLPGPNSPYKIYLTSINVKDATLLITDPNAYGNPDIDRGVAIENFTSINLDNATFRILPNGGGSLRSTGEATINAIAGDNYWSCSGSSFHISHLTLNLRQNATLSVDQFSQIHSSIAGGLNTAAGSTLNILNSGIALIGRPSSIDGSTINLSGAYAGGDDAYSFLRLTSPTITDSTINLDNNTSFRSYNSSSGGPLDGGIFFRGNNQVNLNDGAWISASASTIDRFGGAIYVENGTTSFNESSATRNKIPTLYARSWVIRNQGHAVFNGIFGAEGVDNVHISNGSSLRYNSGATFDALSSFTVENSTLDSNRFEASSDSFRLANATLRYNYGANNRLGVMTFQNKGAAATMQIEGNNLVYTRIALTGIPIAAGYPFLAYSDRLQIFGTAITGVNNLDFRLQVLGSPQPVVSAYTGGGENRDGRFTVADFSGSSVDGDSPRISFDTRNTPVLLDVVLDSKPSVDETVVVRFVRKPNRILLTHPTVTSGNQGSAATLLVDAANSGNQQIQDALDTLMGQDVGDHFDSIHPEPYASYMTVGLEQAQLISRSVMNHATRPTRRGLRREVGGAKELVTHSKRIWTDYARANGGVDGNNDLGSYDYSLDSFIVGADLLSNQTLDLGAYLGVGDYRMDEHDIVTHQIESESVYLGLYFSKTIAELLIRGTTAYGMNDNQSERFVTLGMTQGVTKADYDSHSYLVGTEAEIPIYRNGLFVLTPNLGVAYAYYKQESFEETGVSALDLALYSEDNHSLITSVGLNIGFKPFKWLVPEVYARYDYDWYADANTSHDIEAAIKNSGTGSETFYGKNRGPDRLITEISLNAVVSDSFTVGARAGNIMSDYGNEYTLGLNANWSW